jgi:hypothetical protein
MLFLMLLSRCGRGEEVVWSGMVEGLLGALRVEVARRGKQHISASCLRRKARRVFGGLRLRNIDYGFSTGKGG